MNRVTKYRNLEYVIECYRKEVLNKRQKEWVEEWSKRIQRFLSDQMLQ